MYRLGAIVGLVAVALAGAALYDASDRDEPPRPGRTWETPAPHGSPNRGGDRP